MIEPSNHGWLAQASESALEPDLPICDPHHHLWDDRDGQVARRYMMDEIKAISIPAIILSPPCLSNTCRCFVRMDRMR